MIDLFDGQSDIKYIGTRHGEKLYETLCTREEMLKAVDLKNYYKIPADNRDLNYSKFFNSGKNLIEEVEDYNSHNTKRLNVDETKELLMTVEYVRNQLKN